MIGFKKQGYIFAKNCTLDHKEHIFFVNERIRIPIFETMSLYFQKKVSEAFPGFFSSWADSILLGPEIFLSGAESRPKGAKKSSA